MLKAKRFTVGGLVLTVGAVAVLSASSTAATPAASQVTSSPAASTAKQSAAVQYWTPERMRAAAPYPMPTAHITGPAAKKQAVGVPGRVSGLTPAGAVSGAAATQPAVTGGFTYPYPYTRFAVYPATLRTSFPLSVNGKLFFTQNGGGYVCSATSVIAPSRTRVWTAGHCVADGAGHFDTAAVFVPAYNNGTAPFGSFAATGFTTSTAWLNTYDLSVDFGAFRTGRNAAGKTLAAAVGAAGFAWNQPDGQEWLADAYPAAAPFTGLTEQEVHAPTAARVSVGGIGQAAVGIGSDFTGGSSGGSWRFGAGGAHVGWISGHNDFKFLSPAQPLAMYSPYFTDLANAVRCAGEAHTYGC